MPLTGTLITEDDRDLARQAIAKAELNGTLASVAELFDISKAEVTMALLHQIEATPPGIYPDRMLWGDAHDLLAGLHEHHPVAVAAVAVEVTVLRDTRSMTEDGFEVDAPDKLPEIEG